MVKRKHEAYFYLHSSDEETKSDACGRLYEWQKRVIIKSKRGANEVM